MKPQTEPLVTGSLAWAELAPTAGREQSGRRPVVIVSSRRYLDVVDSLVVVVPLTTTHRGWPNHVAVDHIGLPAPSWAMTEQIRTIARERIVRVVGVVPDATLEHIRIWLTDFLLD